MAMTSVPWLNRFFLPLIIAAAIGVGLFRTTFAADKQTPPAAPPPPAVTVSTLTLQDIRLWTTFSGRLAPIASAEIKPLVSGVIQAVLFDDGQLVEQGQALFLIDPRPHDAALARTKALLQAARSQFELTNDELSRAQRLLDSKLISQSLFDTAQANARAAQAAVAETEAALQQAALNVEYAHISAPVAGRISRAELTQGNVVEAGPNAPVLASIVANERFYAEFNVDEQTYVGFMRSATDLSSMPVELTLDVDDSVVYRGQIHAFDNHLNTASGTIRARAIIDNSDGALTPGMYARVRLGAPQKMSALLIPERAISTNQSKKFVLVVDASDIARYREITLGDKWRSQRVVISGLAAGDRVIVNGLSHVRPDSPVSPTPAADVTAELAAAP